VFAPQLTTIEEFITGFSTSKVPDKLELIHRLYTSYRKVVNTDETFDQFYYWGDMLIRDFNEVDKYMVNASLLFSDLSHQKELDARFDFLTSEQAEFLKNFWGTFDEKTGEYKERFLSLWKQLPEVHRKFKEQLMHENLAYEGMIYRDVAERLEAELISMPVRVYWFIGMNALTTTEEKIMKHAVNAHQVKIIWDVDAYYLHNKAQEAGEFFRQYQSDSVLGNTFDEDVPANFHKKKSVQIYGAAQSVGQAKLLSKLLHELLQQGLQPEETLIVLPDEKLLLPVLHGVSGVVDKLNVTMGFSLVNTSMFNLIELLVELQVNRKNDTYHHKQVLALLGHPYVMGAHISAAQEKRKKILKENWVMVLGTMLRTEHPLHKQIFCEVTTQSVLDYIRQTIEQLIALENLDSLDKEYGLYFLRFLNRMEEVLGNLYQDLKSFLRLFRQTVKAVKIPFTGEPLAGLQIMGVLETRNLDFKNVLVLSLNEGALPSGGGKGSYIPHNIRKAYGLPTTEHQDAIYAYIFYRLLQRAENVYLFYNTETDVLGQGEMSRYLQQLLYESGLTTERHVLHNTMEPQPVTPITVKKNQLILKALTQVSEQVKFQGFSPSALNAYIDCRLKFYFQSVEGIKEPKVVEENADARVLGNLLHKVIELYYQHLIETKKDKRIDEADLEQAESSIDRLLEKVFLEVYKLDPDKKVEFEGRHLVVQEVVKRFAARILATDKLYAPFTMEAMELEDLQYPLKIHKQPGYVVLNGKIDRVDRKENTIRIVDYKTGKDKLEFESIASLFIPGDKRNKAAFQTFLYAFLYRKRNRISDEVKIVPGLLNRSTLFDEDAAFGFTMNKKRVTDIMPLLPEFEQYLVKLIDEIFDLEVPFDQTDVMETCRYCPYKDICHR
jgi:RecB family exonuclease